jgi:hypothetical protein
MVTERFPELERGSAQWKEYASLLVDDPVQELLEMRSRFEPYREEKRIEREDRSVAYTDMQLGCISDALQKRGYYD